MDDLDRELIDILRAMARSGESPSSMLEKILAQRPMTPGPLPAEERMLLVRYFSTAFYFREGQGYPIFGWFPDGRGELGNADIDRILSKRIHQTRPEWE